MRVKQQCLDASAHATNTSIFGKLNPDQSLNTLTMPKIPLVLTLSPRSPATHTSSVPCIPQALTLILALTFEKT